MNKFTRLILFIFVTLIVFLAGGAVAWWAVAVKHWPWWTGLSLGCGVVFLYFLFLFLKKYLIRRRQKKFIDNVVEQKAVVDEKPQQDMVPLQQLESKWKKSLSLLRDSELRKHGNPIYALPWFVALGEAGCGKTTAFCNAGQGTSFTEVENQNGVLPTRNCDWFYFSNAIVLDTAGRYTVSEDLESDHNEWKRFLSLLVKYRKKNVLDGILLFFGADHIDEHDADELAKRGQLIRNRVDSLMRSSGYRLPVYIFVSKMDTIQGFGDFAENLPDETLGQAMGVANSDEQAYWHEILRDGFNELIKKINGLSLFQCADKKEINPASLLFPEQFGRLKDKINALLQPIFSENEFQATPLLAGLYFGSGKSVSNPLSPFLAESLSLSTDNVRKTGSKSVFLHDFLSTIISSPGMALRPIREYTLWKRVTRSLGVVSWGLFCIFLAGVIGMSYQHNTRVLKIFNQQPIVPKQTDLNESDQLIKLENLRLAIQQIDKENSSWLISFFGFTHSERAGAELKKFYCETFAKDILNPMESELISSTAKIDHFDDNELVSVYLVYTVDQINLLSNYMAGRKTSVLPTFEPVTAQMLTREYASLPYEVAQYFDDLYYSYLDWTDDKIGVENRLDKLNKTLDDLLDRKEGDVTWLYKSLVAENKSIHLSKFWGYPDTKELEEIMIPGAFTRAGWKNIMQFIDLLSKSGIQKERADTVKNAFLQSYPEQFLFWWSSFAENFNEGTKLLKSESSWRETAVKMTTDSNPYFSLLKMMSGELNAFVKDTKIVLPQWGYAIIAYNEVSKTAADKKAAQDKKTSILARVKIKEKSVVEQTMHDVDPDKSSEVALQLQLASAWNDYLGSLDKLSPVASYKEKAFQMLADWFNDTQELNKDKPSDFGQANVAIQALEGLAKGKYDNPVAWKIVQGPFGFITEYSARQSARVIQGEWEQQVVSQTYNVDQDRLSSLLFDKDSGFVWKFVNDVAGPFLVQSQQGYRSREMFSAQVNFLPDFYAFLNQAKAGVLNKQESYKVTLGTKPIEVNKEATVDPYSATVVLQCSKEKQVLENDNFQRSKTFNWDPNQCSDATLTVKFPDFTLTKIYPGEMGFVHFLSDFKTGRLSLTPDDFPEQKAALQDIKVSGVELAYSFTGNKAVLKLLDRVPTSVPQIIVRPEDQKFKVKTKKVLPDDMSLSDLKSTKKVAHGKN